ncbi:PHB depolymerase family esterase [Pikeienuella sp. HZG-20]|uniref:extracellular catalytic domain type 1 short-chain-length polyhydroxyalkanoate depolymerase n=1 Tax=Paludibacillus litoralis TaxID=3133267 RepID=UPI0030EB9DC1
MIDHTAGAQRRATGDARSARTASAADLVRRTLAQHGLTPGLDWGPAGTVQTGASAMEDLLTRFTSPLGDASMKEAPIPEGAEFRTERFSCAAGSRAYRTYVPSTAAEGVAGVLVMLHGCTQNPEDFAAGTGMNALAETRRLIVIYPQQSRGDNAQSCWNWFSRGDQRRDRGEPAILAGMTRKAMAEHGAPSDRTFVAGLSAGAAMAVILGETYPDVFSAVGAHSGLPFGAAKDVASAFAAMSGGAQGAAGGRPHTPAVRTIVFHGSADSTVHPSNGERIAQQVMDRGAWRTIETDARAYGPGRSFTRKIATTADGVIELEHWVVDGLAHAWSGGRPGGSYTDAKGPDASAEMVRFFLGAPDQGV